VNFEIFGSQHILRSAVLSIFFVKIQIFWDVTLCPWAKRFPLFERLYSFHLQGYAVDFPSPNIKVCNILPVECRDWCDFFQLNLSVRFDLRLIHGHFMWGQKSIFAHLTHTQGEGIYPENGTFLNFGNVTPNDTASQPRRANVFLLLIRGICVSVKSFPTYDVST
jgi:hypothetical protein